MYILLHIALIYGITLLKNVLYFNSEGAAKYKFGQNYYTISIPVPLGGKTSRDFNLPAALTTPVLNVPQLDLQFESINIPLPGFFIPESLSLSLPLVAKAEVSSKLSSNFYDMEAKASAESELVDKPTYSAKIEITGTSPVDLLSFKMEGTCMLPYFLLTTFL